jgi:HlyD family secretion protein
MTRLICLPLLLALLPGGVGRADDRAGPFRTQPVKRGRVAQTVRATGTLEPEEVIDVGAQVAGQVERLGADPHDPKKAVDFNTRVEAGTVLARLDPSLYRARVEQARAGLRLAQANLKLEEAQLAAAERERERARKLLPAKAISQEDFDNMASRGDVARARVEVAKAAAEQAQAALKEAEINLGYTTIRSPIAGVVLDRRVNVGQTVVPSLSAPSLFLIARDLKRLQVWASVTEGDVAQVHQGQRATFRVDARPGDVFEGKVTGVRLNATMTQNVVTYTVVVETDNTGGKLLPYLTAEVSFVVRERKDVLLVPNAALRWRPRRDQLAPGAAEPPEKDAPETAAVWLEEGGRVRPVKLRLGVSDGVVTEVVAGDLREGTPVVVGGAPTPPQGEGRKDPQPDPGADMLLIQPGPTSRGGASFGKVGALTAEDAEAIREGCPAVAGAAPVVRARTRLTHGERSWIPLYVYGTTPAFLKVRRREGLAEGRAFTEDEVRGRKKVCLVGQTLVKELFGGESPLGQEVRVGGVRFEVVGVLSRAGTSVLGLDQDDILLAPWTAIKDQEGAAERPAGEGQGGNDLRRLYPPQGTEAAPAGRPSDVDQILVRAASPGEAGEAKKQVTALLRERHRIGKGEADDFNIREGMGRRGLGP